MSEGCGGFQCEETGERPSLVRVEEATRSSKEGEVGGGHSFHCLGEGFKEDDEPEGGWRIVGGFPGIVLDNPVSFLERGGVVAILE